MSSSPTPTPSASLSLSLPSTTLRPTYNITSTAGFNTTTTGNVVPAASWNCATTGSRANLFQDFSGCSFVQSTPTPSATSSSLNATAKITSSAPPMATGAAGRIGAGPEGGLEGLGALGVLVLVLAKLF